MYVVGTMAEPSVVLLGDCKRCGGGGGGNSDRGGGGGVARVMMENNGIANFSCTE